MGANDLWYHACTCTVISSLAETTHTIHCTLSIMGPVRPWILTSPPSIAWVKLTSAFECTSNPSLSNTSLSSTCRHAQVWHRNSQVHSRTLAHIHFNLGLNTCRHIKLLLNLVNGRYGCLCIDTSLIRGMAKYTFTLHFRLYSSDCQEADARKCGHDWYCKELTPMYVHSLTFNTT